MLLPSLGGVSAHSELTEKDYASAGHTGFAGTGVANTFTAKQTLQHDVDMAWTNEARLLRIGHFGGAVTLTGNYTADLTHIHLSLDGTVGNTYDMAGAAQRITVDTTNAGAETWDYQSMGPTAGTVFRVDGSGHIIIAETHRLRSSGSSLQVRNLADNAYKDIQAGNVLASGYLMAGQWKHFNADMLAGPVMASDQAEREILIHGSNAFATATTNKVGGNARISGGVGDGAPGQTGAHGGDADVSGGDAAGDLGTSNGGDVNLEGGAPGTSGTKGSGNVFKGVFQDQAVFNAEYDNGNSGGADTVDWGNGNKQLSTLTGDCTFTFTAPAGPCNLMLRLIHDGSARNPTWPATVKWAGGTEPTWSTSASDVDIVSFYHDGTNYYGMAGIDFS